MNIYEKLSAVQHELKVPKDKYNSFGEFHYRSAEGILEAVKPVLAKYKTTIILNDNIEEVGGRVFVKAIAQFCSWEQDGNHSLSVTAFAELTKEKKKLDASQLTGVASSYARKYALNGLLLIDDTKDADTDEYVKQTQETPQKAPETPENRLDKPVRGIVPAPISEAAKATILELLRMANLSPDEVLNKPLDEFTADEATRCMMALRKKVGDEAEG